MKFRMTVGFLNLIIRPMVRAALKEAEDQHRLFSLVKSRGQLRLFA